MLQKILREPLVHFAFLGLIIYGLVSMLSPTAANFNDRTIRILHSDLITYMQKRDQVFDVELYTSKFAAMPAAQRQRLIAQYAEQEVLYREAKNLGLDQNDDVLRRRLIQKLKYFLEGLSRSSKNVSQQQLEQYYAANRGDYEVPANITFTHFFFKEKSSGQIAAKQRALGALEQLQVQPGSDVAVTGDHFPYHRNYVHKSAAQIARHFGTEFASSLFALQAAPNTWQGSIASAYGQHLVRISNTQAAAIPELAAIENKVKEDLARSLFAAAQQSQIDQLVAQYTIQIEPVQIEPIQVEPVQVDQND